MVYKEPSKAIWVRLGPIGVPAPADYAPHPDNRQEPTPRDLLD